LVQGEEEKNGREGGGKDVQGVRAGTVKLDVPKLVPEEDGFRRNRRILPSVSERGNMNWR
jgi:hypothetical protein